MRRVVVPLATAILALAVAAPVSAEPRMGTGAPSEHVVYRDYSYRTDECGIPLDVVERTATTYWFDDTGGLLKIAGPSYLVWTNPATGKWLQVHMGGVLATRVVDWSPARQEAVIGRTLADGEVLLRYQRGGTWGVRSSDGRTITFKATGEWDLWVWNWITGEVVWSLWGDAHGGGSYGRFSEMYDSPCDLYLDWLT